MNNQHENDEDLSERIQAFVQMKMDNGKKNEFMAGTYCCSGDNGELVKIQGYLGTALIKSHIEMILAYIMWNRPSTAASPQKYRKGTKKYYPHTTS